MGNIDTVKDCGFASVFYLVYLFCIHHLLGLYYTREKGFSKTSFQLKKGRNKAEMEEHKKTTGHLQKYAADVQ